MAHGVGLPSLSTRVGLPRALVASEDGRRVISFLPRRLMVAVRVPDLPNGPPDREQDDRDKGCNHQLGRHDIVESRNALDEIGEKADHIIGDRGDGQTFDGLLKPQLQFGAIVHRGQQFAVLTLDLHVDPGSQQRGGTRQLVGQSGLPLLDRPAGPHREDFSSNTVEGACPTCHGLGRVYDATEKTMVPDPSLTIRERAIAAWPPAWHGQNLRDILVSLGYDIDTPWRDLPKKDRDWILFTDEQPTVPVYPGFTPRETRAAIKRHMEPGYQGTFTGAAAMCWRRSPTRKAR